MRGGALVLLLDRLFRGIALSAGLAVIVMVLVICYGVAARDLFRLSDTWVTDLTTYLMGYMTFVGTATLAWQGRHVKIEIAEHVFGARGKRVLSIAAGLISTIVAVTLFWLSAAFWQDAWESGERSWGMLSIPLWIPYLSLLVGGALLAVAQIVRLALALRGAAAPDMDSGR